MKEAWNWIQVCIAALGGWLGYFLGGWDGFMFALVTFVSLDYITGVMCAITNIGLFGFRNNTTSAEMYGVCDWFRVVET